MKNEKAEVNKMLKNDFSPICRECNRYTTKLVPYCDDGSGLKMCISCKRKKKQGIKIMKFERGKNE